MKKILLNIIIIFSLKCSAQYTSGKTIDSLKDIVATAEENTNKVLALYALSGDYRFSYYANFLFRLQINFL
jgi:hypothetical protein